MDAELKAHLEQMEARLKAHASLECEKIETKLLREFWKWGSTSDIRTRQSMETAHALNERMLNAEPHISPRAQQNAPARRRRLNRQTHHSPSFNVAGNPPPANQQRQPATE